MVLKCKVQGVFIWRQPTGKYLHLHEPTFNMNREVILLMYEMLFWLFLYFSKALSVRYCCVTVTLSAF